MPTKKKRNRKWIVWVVVLIVVAVLIGASALLRSNTGTIAAYEPEAAISGNISVTVNGSGAIASHDADTLYVKYASEVKDVVAETGDSLKQGEIIAVLESDTLDDAISNMRTAIDDKEDEIKHTTVDGSDRVRTIAEGRVKELFVEDDDDIDNAMSNYGALAVISTDDMLKADIKVANTASYNVGNQVVVMVDDDKENATVKAINKLSSEITVVFEDDEDEDYEIGDMVMVEDSNGEKVGEGVLAVNHPVFVTAVGGTVDDLRVDVNDWVSEGETIMVREGDVYNEDYIFAIDQLSDMREDLAEMEAAKDDLVVRATMDGIVTELNINEGQHLQQGAMICKVEGNTMLKILVEIDELDIAKITVGQEAEVDIDALEKQTYTAVVIEINPLGVSENNVTNYWVTLELPAHADILLGMSAEVDILAEEKIGVVLIPLSAVQTISNEHYVMYASEIGQLDIATHPIEIGISDGVNVEVLSGLAAGDEVAIPVEMNDTMSMMMGGPPSEDQSMIGDN